MNNLLDDVDKWLTRYGSINTIPAHRRPRQFNNRSFVVPETESPVSEKTSSRQFVNRGYLLYNRAIWHR